MQEFGQIVVTLPNVGDQCITALQASFQYSDTLNISNETTVRQYRRVIDQNKKIGNAVETLYLRYVDTFILQFFNYSLS